MLGQTWSSILAEYSGNRFMCGEVVPESGLFLTIWSPDEAAESWGSSLQSKHGGGKREQSPAAFARSHSKCCYILLLPEQISYPLCVWVNESAACSIPATSHEWTEVSSLKLIHHPPCRFLNLTSSSSSSSPSCCIFPIISFITCLGDKLQVINGAGVQHITASTPWKKIARYFDANSML
jgi:hypothetical protein